MFYLPLSKFNLSHEAFLAPGAIVLAEGQAMVRQPGAMAEGVLPSTGSNTTEVFVGFSIAGTSAAPFPDGYVNKVEDLVSTAGGSVTLQFTPVAGQYSVTNAATGAVITPVTQAGPVLSGITASTEVLITYKYAASVTQMRALQGDIQPGGYVGSYVNQIGLITNGLAFTSEFDTSVNWAAATAIKLAPNGQVTDQSGTGAVIPNAFVSVLPTTDIPFLGIEFSAP